MMHPVANIVSQRGLKMLPKTSRQTAVLVLSRGFSRRVAASSNRPSSMRNISTRKTTTSSNNNKGKKPMHSSAKTQQSTLSMEQANVAATRPTYAQLKILFTASAVPMIGFGIMDNMVMIQAGQLIDSTLGVTMGLATMTAAAAGQVVSDVSGVIFGGSLERFLHRYKLIHASNLTPAQRALPICRNVAMLGAVCGVALGCGIGACSLLFIDLKAKERAEQGIRLQTVLNDMIGAAGDGVADVQCETCTLHLAGLSAEQLSTSYTKNTGKTNMMVLPNSTTRRHLLNNDTLSLPVRAAKMEQSLTSDDASVLCTPIMSEEGEVVAVLEFKAKTLQGFTEEDKKAAKVMARHIAIFMNRLSN